MSTSNSITITEVGMRDGFQFEDIEIPTSFKISTLHGLIEAGAKRIQVTSFVHPKWVPQMADAEEICAALPPNPEMTYTALALNVRGVVRAHNAGIENIDLSISTNDQHSRDNANMSHEDALQQALEMIELAQSYGMQIQMGFQCVFGYKKPGDTPLNLLISMLEPFSNVGLESISLADSTGMANPKCIKETLAEITALYTDIPIVLHLHDTRGTGLANVCAALECGITHFDTSLGGLGGCPFIPGATGNIATEDTVYLLESMGLKTGIDINKLSEITSKVSQHLQRELPGKLYKLIAPHALSV